MSPFSILKQGAYEFLMGIQAIHVAEPAPTTLFLFSFFNFYKKKN
jgi:hypothetical protein